MVIVMRPWTVFWTPPAQIAVRFGFSATSILTVIACRLALANQVPPLSSSTQLGVFLNGASILAFLALVQVILTTRLFYRERVAAAERVDFHARWVFPSCSAPSPCGRSTSDQALARRRSQRFRTCTRGPGRNPAMKTGSPSSKT